jgi:hypothetical protein
MSLLKISHMQDHFGTFRQQRHYLRVNGIKALT